MRALLRILKSRAFLSILGFGLLVGLVLLLGAWLQWTWTVRLLGVIGVLIVGMIVLMIQFARANRSSDQIEKSIKAQAAQQVVSARPDNRAEIEELQRQLEEAIERLKQSKLGQGKRGRAALYALPWYLFIGPPGAGKTTAIANSGLHFPIGADRIRGVGGTRNCDWFFTDQAILLDTAGRYMTEAEDADEWLAFLDTLKQHRSERPINGVLVGIAASDLALATSNEIEWHADNIRRRMDELVRRLGVRFPVYLVFTKCDLLQGFVEFFGDMSRREREQIWGATLTEEQQQSDDLQAVFEREFEVVTSALVNRRSARLSRSMKREDRQQVYAFPLQLASLKDNLGPFVRRLFQPNPYQENPTLRGFYFTSGTQEGIPLDRVIQTIARQFDLPAAGAAGQAPEMEVKSYFIKDLFTDVVVPDQYMVQRTTKASRKGSVRRLGVTVASVVLLALFLLAASQAFLRSRSSFRAAGAVAATTSDLGWDVRAAAVDHLGTIDGLREEIDRLDRPKWLRLGLSRDGAVLRPARRLYLDHARAFVRAYPLQALEGRLQQAARQGRIEAAEREALTMDLKAYLLLSDERARLDEEANRNFLVRYLSDLAVVELEADAAGQTRGELRDRAERPVQAYVEALRAEELTALAADPDLIRVVRARIDEPPSIRTLYTRIRLEGLDALPPFRLEDAVPGRFATLLRSSAEVPGFFTRRGWDTYVSDKIAEVSKNPTGEDWVMGRSGADAEVELGTEEQVTAGLEELYFTEYGAEWERFLRSVQVKSFADLREAARALGELGDASESPIGYLLASVTEQTRFQSALLGQLEDQVGQAAERAVQRQARRLGARGGVDTGLGDQEDELPPVDRRFQWLHNLKADAIGTGGASSDLYRALSSLQNVGNSLEGIATDEAAAAAFAIDVLGRNGGELDRALRDISSSLAAFNQDARNQLFQEPVMRAWQAVLGAAQAHLNTRWREVVYQPFRTRLASLYPFDPTSGADVPLFDAEAYFAPESGVVTTFVREELAPYVGRDVDRPLSWRGSGIRLSVPAREAIRRAQAIAASLFEGGRMRVSFEMQPEQPTRSATAPPPDQVSLRLLGREDTYRMGFRQWTSYEWPGEAGAVLSVSTQQGDLPPRRYEGAWALFRMLQDGRLTRVDAAQFQLQWPFEAPGRYTIMVRYDLRTQRAANPFGDLRGFFNFKPPEALN